MSGQDPEMLWTLLEAGDLRLEADALRRRTGIRVEPHENASQDIEVHIVLEQEGRGAGKARGLREAEKLAVALERRIVDTLGPERLADRGFLMAELDTRERAGESNEALAKDLSQRVRQAVRKVHRRQDRFKKTGRMTDKRAIWRAWADASRLVRAIGIPITVVKDGLDKLAEGDLSFQQWEPVSWERVREILDQWRGRAGKRGGRRTAPARLRYLKAFNAKDYDRFRRTLERFGMAVPSPTDLRREIKRAWSQKRKALNATVQGGRA